MRRWSRGFGLLAVLIAGFAHSGAAAAENPPAEGGQQVKFGYTIVYVADVAASVEFWGTAFGLAARFVHPSGEYTELETGDTALAFVIHEKAGESLPGGFRPIEPDKPPVGMEIALVTADVAGAHARAVAAGSVEVAPPATKPWGQTVS